MATGRSRKKNKFKFNERSASSVRDHCSVDPAFTDDVRHLALPLRRNSGPESEAAKMFGKKKSKSNSKDEHSSHYSLRMERRKNSNVQANNYSAEYLCKNSSSSESLDNIISSYRLKGRKGFSLDRNIQSFDVERKPQVKPKRSSWFLRDRNRDKQSKKEKFLKRSSLDFTVMYDTKQTEKPRSKAKPIQRQNAADYTGDSSTTTPQEESVEPKKSGLSKFQIGKRFLKGEIGIRSFNYYLLKEGLKKNQGKQKQESITTKPTYKSKSEENIYEEIYFLHDQATPKPKSPPALPPFNKQSSVPLLKVSKKPTPDDGNCMNCEICLQEANEKHSTCNIKNCDKCSHQQQNLKTGSLSGSEGYAQVNKKINDKSIYDFFQQQQQQGQTMLQFQSYNPSNPNVYKIESTPVAFDYTPIEEQIYQMELSQQYVQGQKSLSGDGKIKPKSSSSNDSIKGNNQRHRHQQQHQSNEFYTRPNFCYPTSDKQSRKDQGNINNNSMFKTDSSNSIRSENSLNKIYNSKNSSQKSNQSNKSSKSVNSNHNRDEAQLRQDMSDSSLGDSLFSSDANKRYFGSSESCRFNYECRRRCSLENEKCSFSDTCRYECNLRNCDCSSSYFSSDFDDTNIYNTTNNNNNRMIKSHHQQQQPPAIEYQQQQIYEQKTNRYAEDFIKHVTNVKRRSQNIPYDGSNVLITTHQLSIYEVPKQHPKRLDIETGLSLRIENVSSKMNAGGYDDEIVGLEESSDRMVMLENDKTTFTERGVVKATGTVPKLSSSISSNESKKKKSGQKHDKVNIQKEAKQVPSTETETMPIVKTVQNDEKLRKDEKSLSIETLSATLEINSTEKPKSALEKSKNEQQKSIVVIDDDDDVFLESHQEKTTKDCDTKVVKPLEIKHAEVLKPEIITKMSDTFIAPNKAQSKAPGNEASKVDVKQAANIKINEVKQAIEIKNNNKATLSKPNADVVNESDDDDSVFINENKPKKANKTLTKTKLNVEPASNNASSVMLNEDNVSSLNIKPVAPVAAQNHNSRDLNVKSETVVREQTGKHSKVSENHVEKSEKSKSIESQKLLNDPSDQLDFSKIPLPDIPSKKKQLSKGKSLSKDSLPTSATGKIQSKWKQLTEKEYFKKMHYRNSSLEKKPPTYLFGESTANKTKDGIFLNRSGWLQTNQQRLEKGSESRKENINKLKAANSKIEELISRSEARKGNQPIANSKDDNVTILKIDPKSEPRQILNDRPGFLPVKSNLSRDGPPPTPILSPPPAFQDHKFRNRIIEMKNGTRIQLSVTDSDNKTSAAQIGKGMVFSRSFEYDNRKTAEFNENFSRSFDFDFQLNEKSGLNKNFLSRYGNSNTFANLTGASPNYLTKKETPTASMTSIFPKVIPGNKVKMGNLSYYNNPNYNSVDDGLSRRSQFTRPNMSNNNNYRSLEANTSSINNRLNSCDSGARSDFSNDDLDEDPNDDEEEDDEPSSSLALSYKSAAAASHFEPMKSNRNVTKTLLNQQQTQFKKTRTMTPETSFDDYDLLTVNRNNLKKQQRSPTPEKRPVTPEMLHKSSKLTASQTSLMSRQSSGSRNSTLERQLKRYEEGRLSRSSSSSTEADNHNRRSHRPPFKTNFGDYRIRRSRSLQLSERSPNRSQLQKVVVRIGNTPAPQSTNNTSNERTKHRDKPDYVHTRSKTTLNMPSKQSLRNSDNSLQSSTQAKSFEMLDFNGKSSMDYGFESDSKSKSFDDDFCFNTKVTRNGNGNRNVFSGNRAFSQDRVLTVPSSAAASKSLRNSPRNYGSRLYDHDILYDVASRRAATRSPLLNFNNRISVNPPLSRERSPIAGRRSRDKERDSYKKQSSNNFLKPRTTTTPNRSPNRSPSDSDDSINENANKILKDKSLVAEYLFGLKRKQQANLNRSGNQSGTPSSSGSCTSSSCEYWPQSGRNAVKHPSVDDKSYVDGSHNKISVHNDSDSSGNNVKVSVKTQQQKQQAYLGTTVTINGAKSTVLKRLNKPISSSIIFLGDCEMPITKSVTRKNSGSDTSAHKINESKAKAENHTKKILITSRLNGDGKQQVPSLNQQARTQNYSKGKFSTSSFSTTDTTVRRRHFTRLQSRSLPKSFMRSRNLSSDANELSAMFPPHSPLQMRAVSSPSLTETPAEIPASKSPTYSAKPEPNGRIQNHQELNDRSGQNPSASSGSVLQKFKKTFFKNGKSNVPLSENIEINESKHHRFGPLVWRSSKERRKTKSHRRDKCNSGDSGIQVELENDENLSENVPSQRSMDISPQLNAKVRRANSAKVTTSSIKFLHKNEAKGSTSSSITSKRSLSQPSDLDAIVCENKMMNNLENIKHIDDDDGSDTDSLTSNHVEEIEEDSHSGVVYAEVLYQFQAGGPQELSLMKGSLVEVLKRESGPWWWGRLKFDAIVSEEAFEVRQGWFPKDFVKVMPTFGQNRKNMSQSSTEFDCDNQPPTSAAPSISSSQSSSEIMRDNVIKELLETEINYVKLLNALVEGFIKEMKEHPDIFSFESIFLIFSNMEQIYRFQQTFLEALRLAIPNGRIAEVFLEFQTAFMVYSQYCNSYPRALMELENYSNNKEASAILENCRITQNLPELPLSAHLLAPIQRICRYPLHLSELVKHSRARKEILLKLDVHQLSKHDIETIDCKEMFEVGLNAMKRVTEMVNEGKRHSEYLSKVQARFESFQGPSINVHSTRLFLQTDAIRVSPNLWNNTYTLFLFDRQLIYCKKDLLKRTSYIYKGRIFLDNCRILNLPDGKMFGVNLKNALRMFCETRGKWFDFCFRSSSSKLRFLNTLSAERQFCGSSLFVSELAPGLEDENLSDETNGLNQEYDERGIDVDPNIQVLIGNMPSNGSMESPVKQQKFSDSLPKKPRKLSKEAPSQIIIDYNPSNTSAGVGKRRLGNWFRKSKSTNSTPSQSPTHHPLVATSTVPSIVNHSDSNSSSQSSPINYARPKFKETSVGGSS